MNPTRTEKTPKSKKKQKLLSKTNIKETIISQARLKIFISKKTDLMKYLKHWLH